MNKPATLLDYSRRIERVVTHIGENLDGPIDLERLADLACFSPYHFHRIYRGITGETAADSLRRLRLHRAAGELVGQQTPIAAIARRAGYGSVAAFVRAFGSTYGLPPAAYRRQGRLVLPTANAGDKETTMYDVRCHYPRPAAGAPRRLAPHRLLHGDRHRLR